MARDYKNTPKNRPGGGALGTSLTFGAGLVTGLCVVIVMYLLEAIPGLDTAQTRAPSAPPVATPTPAEPERETREEVRQPKPETRPKFDFYTILPEMEVSVPEWEANPPPAAPAEETPAEADTPAVAATDAGDAGNAQTGDDHTAATTGDSYILQIGSFRQPDEAERVKARLALLGLDTEIQRVVIDDGDVWHRVRAGPYQDARALNQARQRLIDNNIDFMLLKLKRDRG